MIKIDFEFDTVHGIFRDALHFQDGAVPSEDEIEAMKIARRDAWINFIENPPPNPNSFPEEEIIEEQAQGE